MSVLDNLRQRSGLMAVVIGGALFAFIVPSLFDNSGIGQQDNSVGEIAGKSIEYPKFNSKVQEAINNKKRNEQKTNLSEAEKDQIVQNVWNQFINEEVIQKEYEKLGISVSPKELYDIMVANPTPSFLRYISDPNTGKVNPLFANEVTGQVSSVKLKAFLDQMTPDQERDWNQLEKVMEEIRTSEKYSTLLKQGLYVTVSQAKRIHEDNNRNVDAQLLSLYYKTLKDADVTYTDSDLNTYYTSHKQDFKQEDSRSIEYVSYDITPSEEDNKALFSNMLELTKRFKENTSKSEDSLFVIVESDTRIFDNNFYTKGTLSPTLDSVVFNSEVGLVVGPYIENNAVKVSKLIAKKTAADSAKVRHILIAHIGAGLGETITRTKDEAKIVADSLLGLLKSRKANFVNLVADYSDDGGKTKPADKADGEDYPGKNGDYGWLNANSGFVTEFKNAGLDGKRGDISVVESQFGYHIIEVLNTNGKVEKVQIATLERAQQPSNQTMQNIFLKASKFAGENTTYSLFQKGVSENGLSKRLAEDIKENAKIVPGIEASRSLIRWMYENEEGSVSEPQELGSRYIVAVLSKIKEKGFAPLEDVKTEVTAAVIKEKKAEIFVKQFNEAVTENISFTELAKKMNLNPTDATAINFNAVAIPRIGNEVSLIGAIAIQEENTISTPLIGNTGVYVVSPIKVNEAPAIEEFGFVQSQELNKLQPRSDYEIYGALKDNANVKEHLVKFY